MSDSPANKIGRVSAYILGVALLLVGIVSLGIQIELGSTSPDPFPGYLLEVVFIICGALTCLATRLRYGGGFWSVLGVDFIGFGFIGVASIFEHHLRAAQDAFSTSFYLRVVIFSLIGVFCLVRGEMRRQKLRRATI